MHRYSPSDLDGALPPTTTCRMGSDDSLCGVLSMLEASRSSTSSVESTKVPLLPLSDSPIQTSLWSGTLSCVDWYLIGIAATLWRQQRADCWAVCEAFFRQAPFNGAFAVLGGVGDVVELVRGFKFQDQQLDFIRERMPDLDDDFLEYLRSLHGGLLEVRAVEEGSVVFPKAPILQIRGPLALCQLLETHILTTLGYSTLIATKAVRYRLVAGWKVKLLEFGMRRGQGPSAALSASRFAFVGSFDGTSNTQAAAMYSLPLFASMSHAYIGAFGDLSHLKEVENAPFGPGLLNRLVSNREAVARILKVNIATNDGELAAFAAFAQEFPKRFIALVDTYDTLRSGTPNFLCVALAMFQCGLEPIGIRLDSGDLAALSKEVRAQFRQCEEATGFPFGKLMIVASDSINEELLNTLNEQGHEIDSFGIGTHLVSGQSQPPLGMVFKLVELDGRACMKLSQDIGKTTLPGAKDVYRLFDKDGMPAGDLIQTYLLPHPSAGLPLVCCALDGHHEPYNITPAAVQQLLVPVFIRGQVLGGIKSLSDNIKVARSNCISQMKLFEKRGVFSPSFAQPFDYKVWGTEEYVSFFRQMSRAGTATSTLKMV